MATESPNSGKILAARLVEALEAWESAERNFFPGIVPRLREQFGPLAASLSEARTGLAAHAQSPGEHPVDSVLLDASGLCLDALALATEADWLEASLVNFRKAGRRIHRVQEMLFGLCAAVDAIHRHFLEPQACEVPPEPPAGRANPPSGLLQAGLEKDPYARGSCSFYIPPGRDGAEPLPLVVALHGGFGHGRDFIWSWLRETRSRRFALACPSSRNITWSITGPDADEALLRQVVTYAASHWKIDSRRILLTGISDGATYALKRALDAQTPFSHFAVVSGILAPFERTHAKGRPIYWVHGAKDWMFPVWRAKMGEKELSTAGAEVTLEVVDDLYHAYPREKNDRILSWFEPRLALPDKGC